MLDDVMRALDYDVRMFLLNRLHSHSKMEEFDIEAEFKHDILKIKFKPIK